MGSPYKQFETNVEREQKGVEIPYDGYSITIARAGGSNKRYLRLLAEKAQPLRRALANPETAKEIDPDQINIIMRDIFAETIILSWKNVVGRNGKKLAFNKANVVTLLKDLPELFADIQGRAANMNLFLQANMEDDEGNS